MAMNMQADAILAMSYEPTFQLLRPDKQFSQWKPPRGLRGGRLLCHGLFKKGRSLPPAARTAARNQMPSINDLEEHKYKGRARRYIRHYLCYKTLSTKKSKIRYSKRKHLAYEIDKHGPDFPWLPWNRFARFMLSMFVNCQMHTFMDYLYDQIRLRSDKFNGATATKPKSWKGVRTILGFEGWKGISLNTLVEIGQEFAKHINQPSMELIFQLGVHEVVIGEDNRLLTFLKEIRLELTRGGQLCPSGKRVTVCPSSLGKVTVDENCTVFLWYKDSVEDDN